jgi:hypothetical protein
VVCNERCSPKKASFVGGILTVRDDPLINLYEKWLENVSFNLNNACDPIT